MTETVHAAIQRHRNAFAALQKQIGIVDRLDEDSPEWAAEQLELSRLEDEVESAATAMTRVRLTSIAEIVALLTYVEEFSRMHRSGHLLWPDVVLTDGGAELPWAFALIENLRRNLSSKF